MRYRPGWRERVCRWLGATRSYREVDESAYGDVTMTTVVLALSLRDRLALLIQGRLVIRPHLGLERHPGRVKDLGSDVLVAVPRAAFLLPGERRHEL